MKINPEFGEAVKLVEAAGISDALVIGLLSAPEYLSASARVSLRLLTVTGGRGAIFEEHLSSAIPHLSKYGPERLPYWLWPHEMERQL